MPAFVPRLKLLTSAFGKRASQLFFVRHGSGNPACIEGKKGLVVGVYEGCCPGEFKLTHTACKFDESVSGKLRELIKGTKIKKGSAQVFGNLGDEFYLVAAAGLGHESAEYNSYEALDECKENIRIAAGVGAMALQDQGIRNIYVDDFTNTEAAAEGAGLAVWKYQDWKNYDDREKASTIDLYSGDHAGWIRGLVKAEAQNMAREIEETPGNLMTPNILTRFMQQHLCPCGVRFEVKDREWLECNGFHGLLTMAKGSCEPPMLVELKYCGADMDDRPIGFVGKGATFDTGGMALKPCKGMSEHRADLAGTAAIVGMFRAIARMQLPINVVALLGVYENMISGTAAKPGDVVMSRNGKTVKIEDTDNEGRVATADILSYLEKYQPCLSLNLSTSAIGMKTALGSPPSAVYSTSDIVWSELNRAGSITGDRVWRMPFWKYYRSKIREIGGVDTTNVGKGPGGYPCLGAAFLLEFAPACIDFVHLDISGSGMQHTGIGMPYIRKSSMTGRPVRTLVQFLYQIACPHEHFHDC